MKAAIRWATDADGTVVLILGANTSPETHYEYRLKYPKARVVKEARMERR